MTNENRLIDANAVVAELKENVCKNCNSHNGIRCDYCWADDVIDFLQETPTVDAVEVVHGRWEDGICTMCGYPIPTDSKCDFIDEDDCLFCYHCGAKMKGENEDG